MLESKRKKISILGSCVSRDALAVSDFDIDVYRARSTFQAMKSSPTDLDSFGLNIGQIDSGWMQECLRSDFEKNHVDLMIESAPDAIVIDAIDERFYRFIKDQEVVSYSEILLYHIRPLEIALRNSGYDCRSPYDPEVLSASLEGFMALILELSSRLPETHIIYHHVRWARKYISKTGVVLEFDDQNLVDTMNEFQDNYLEAAQSITGVSIVDLSNDYLADESQRWGLANYHFEPNYNHAVTSAICDILQK